MAPRLPMVYIVRHGTFVSLQQCLTTRFDTSAPNASPIPGETEWSKSGQHTSLTDIPLTENGIRQAKSLSYFVFENPHQDFVEHARISRRMCSPLKRAKDTLGYLKFENAENLKIEIDPDLTEWNYGDYEGIRTREIQETRPGWNIFDAGCPGGETAADVAARCDRVIGRIREHHTQCAVDDNINADVLVVAHSHLLRVFMARWLGLKPENGRYWVLDTASLSILGYEHDLTEPVIKALNVTSHLWFRG
ncbi:phosphoglycerate mutase protein [Jimgerdemannia flammicorona]|uniref:Phosphoglycerate mutase protein n=1 Tax=Jimgerdemannia flammicorona TaxID=994334 RepID=A0A433QTS8_9FUNG|nr:phosphoglycerate mutase protein [Jimgerdemannia flammicorona]